MNSSLFSRLIFNNEKNNQKEYDNLFIEVYFLIKNEVME
jgi:hypothetical protein